MFGFRCPEDLGRGVDLFYNAFVEKGDTVRDIARKAHLMGHADHRHAFFGQQAHRIEHLANQFWIECGSGLIKQHIIGLHRQGARDGEALLLPAGQGTWIDIELVTQPHMLQLSGGDFTGFGAGFPCDDLGGQRHVFQGS